MQDRKSFSMETAGSLVPELEGAPHSTSHDRRPSSQPSKQEQKKGGKRHFR